MSVAMDVEGMALCTGHTPKYYSECGMEHVASGQSSWMQHLCTGAVAITMFTMALVVTPKAISVASSNLYSLGGVTQAPSLRVAPQLTGTQTALQAQMYESSYSHVGTEAVQAPDRLHSVVMPLATTADSTQLPEGLAPAAIAGGLLIALAAAAWTAFRSRPAGKKAPWELERRYEGEVPADPPSDYKYNWGSWFGLPLQPYGRKVTLETEVVKDTVWTHEQIQGTVNVVVPVRQTVIKLKGGGLWVHNPVAPTRELINMMRDLEEMHGPVQHIVLGTLGIEHKYTAGPFSRKFPRAQVWAMPGQYSFPLDLPNAFLGFTVGVQELPFDPAEVPWGDEIDYKILGPISFQSIGGFGETAFFHKKTRTLLVTDSIVKVDDEPPAIVTEDPRALLYHARDTIEEEVLNTPENRRRGWRRIAQFGLNFLPSSIDVVPAGKAITDVGKRPKSMDKLGGVAFGLTPWEWARDDRPSFKALQGGLLVAPILRELIFNRYPDQVLDWADDVAQWPFTRIIPCHLSNDIKAGPKDFRRAFEFLEAGGTTTPSTSLPLPVPIPSLDSARAGPLPEDGKLLVDFNKALIATGVLPPPKTATRRAKVGAGK